MSLNSLIISTLAPTGVPVNFQTYSGAEIKYITFFEYNQQGALFADNLEKNTRHSIQVDIWSKNVDNQGNYGPLVEQVRTLMASVGFTRNSENEFYEKDTETFHKVFRFYYTN